MSTDAVRRPPSIMIQGRDGHWHDYVHALCLAVARCLSDNPEERQMIREARVARLRWMRRNPRRRKPPLRSFYEPIDYGEVAW